MVIQLNMENNKYGIYNNFDFVKQYNLCILSPCVGYYYIT